MKLWVFGQSMSTAYDVDEQQGWPYLLANKLGVSYENSAKPSVDNFFIYQCFLEKLNNIQKQDIVVVGWSHPNRKLFLLNDNHDNELLKKQSQKFQTETKTFYRSPLGTETNIDNWLKLTPSNRGLKFYDEWFKNYHSVYEQRINFQSYVDSVKLRCPAKLITFYFSKESIAQTDLESYSDLFQLDFIIDNKYNISKTNAHLNSAGHLAWADIIYKKLQI